MGDIIEGIFGWLGTKEQSKSEERTRQASQQATDKILSYARETRDQGRADTAQGRAVGDAAQLQMARMLGLQLPTSFSSTPNALSPAATGGGTQWDAYLRQYPDVAAAARANQAQYPDDDDFAAYHWQTYGQQEGRTLPSSQSYSSGPGAGYNAPVDYAAAARADPRIMAAWEARPADFGADFNSWAQHGYTSPGGWLEQGHTLPQAPQPAGTQPGNALATGYDFSTDPSYQWRFKEAMRGLNASAGAKGLLKSGAAAHAAMDLAGHMASQEFDKTFGRFGTLAGYGQAAAGQNIQVGQNFMNSAQSALTTNAANLGSSYVRNGQNWGQFYGYAGNQAGKAANALLAGL